MNFTKSIPVVLIIFGILSCKGNLNNNQGDHFNGGEKTTDKAQLESKQGTYSAIVWISDDFEVALSKNISICDCWEETKFHFLYLDTNEHEVYLKSNLKHFGHDSEFTIGYEKMGDSFFLDSTYYDPRLQAKKLIQTSTDEVTLYEGDATYTFNKRIIEFEIMDGVNTASKFDLSDFYYALNSKILLKYNAIDTIQSTHNLITIEELHDRIKSGKVSGHCSDDFGWDGMTIFGDTNRYFHLEFRENQVSIYDVIEGRGRYQDTGSGYLTNASLESLGDTRKMTL